MSDTENPTIAVRENGFVRAANIPKLIDSDGSEKELRPVMALCRCGQSANKPFCDGSHKRNGFEGAGTDNSARDSVKTYEGREVNIHYARLLCSHAGECGARLSAVFNTDNRPWIQPDNGTLEQIKEVVCACPSGALRYNLKGEEPQHLTPSDPSITVEKDGPYRVAGIPLEDQSASENGASDKYVLCRCGLSKNKPFCDGTHKDEGWSDQG